MTSAPAPDLDGLDRFLDVTDPTAFTPRPAVFRVVHDATASTGRPVTARELYALLRARGFREVKRDGVRGFLGIRVPADTPTSQFVPEHSASSYRRGDRSPAAKQARWAQDAPWSTDPDAPDRFAQSARARYLANQDRAAITRDLPRLKREARDLGRVIGSQFGGAGAPALHPDAVRLRKVLDQIESIKSRARAVTD